MPTPLAPFRFIRLRVALSAAHSFSDVDQLAQAVVKLGFDKQEVCNLPILLRVQDLQTAFSCHCLPDETHIDLAFWLLLQGSESACAAAMTHKRQSRL